MRDMARAMTKYVALLRAINVGGTGKLAMADLVALCREAGLSDPKTYIQSGNVVFGSRLGEAKVRATLEKALHAKLGKPVAVLVRDAAELQQVLADNPFDQMPPNRVIVVFLPESPPDDALAGTVAPGGEELHLRGRHLYIYFPNGQGRSKLKVPFAREGTARNINTVTKLLALMQR